MLLSLTVHWDTPGEVMLKLGGMRSEYLRAPVPAGGGTYLEGSVYSPAPYSAPDRCVSERHCWDRAVMSVWAARDRLASSLIAAVPDRPEPVPLESYAAVTVRSVFPGGRYWWGE
uniref:(northern house mosquito) hypothetical protein n=1 Tax=Culex pipiens TaxID=7175 RepID=A0A8D8I5H0_CULPI